MATTTTKLALTKPDGTDLVDIAVLNANADKIDAASGATICTSSTRPASPWNGQVIFETDTLNALVYRTSTTSWNILGGSTVASTPPAGAGNGNFWWDSDNGKLYIYYNDGNSSQWVSVMPSQTVVDVTENYIINGGFDIWQRGTSFNIGSGIYCADRWQTTTVGGINVLVTKDTSVPSPQVQASLKFAPSANGTPGEYALRQFIEQQQIVGLAGKSVTLSFWYKSTKTTHKARVGTQTATGGTDVTQTFTVVPNTWTKISLTFSTFSAITAWTGSMSGAGAYVDIGFADSTAMTTSDNFYIAGVQLEAGAVATAFRRNAPSIQGELAACQRYYYRNTASSGTMTAMTGPAASGSVTVYVFTLPVSMRTYPASVESGGTVRVYQGPSGYAGGTLAINTNSSSLTGAYVAYTHTSSVFTAGYATELTVTGGGYFGFSAEL